MNYMVKYEIFRAHKHLGKGSFLLVTKEIQIEMKTLRLSHQQVCLFVLLFINETINAN